MTSTHGDGPSARPAAGSRVEVLLEEALGLAARTRHLVASGAHRGGDDSPLAALELAAELGRVTTRITACVAWLLGRMAVVRGELVGEEGLAPTFRLLAIGRFAEHGFPCAGSDGFRSVAEESRVLYARIRRLDRALDEQMVTRH